MRGAVRKGFLVQLPCIRTSGDGTDRNTSLKRMTAAISRTLVGTAEIAGRGDSGVLPPGLHYGHEGVVRPDTASSSEDSHKTAHCHSHLRSFFS